MVTLDAVERLLGGADGKRILLSGTSYRGGVGDTRHSPSAVFARAATARGASLVCHDPIATEWDLPELLVAELPAAGDFDAVVIAVAHDEYAALDLAQWLGDARPLSVDANRVLADAQLRDLARRGCWVWAIGRGDIEA
jgi:UDP-N-acetyl-D-glucosamine dehydrogenase